MPHDHHHHHHAHHHDDGPEDAEAPPGPRARLIGAAFRYALALLVVLGAIAGACLVMVPAGEAVVITRFGAPVRVLTAPGAAWKWPPPAESVIPVDLRLYTTSTGVQDVGTRDGLRILLQAYIAWKVPADPARIRTFLSAARNDHDEAARQLSSLVGAALQITASSFDLAQLVNADPKQVQQAAFEQRLQAQVQAQLRDVYGIEVAQLGIESLSLPPETMTATVERMRAERQTVAAQRTAEGAREAAAITADADRDSKVMAAEANTEAAAIEAKAQAEAAKIQADAYQGDPALYTLLRSLDALTAMIGANTKLILRTDAAPFRMLVDGPEAGK